MTSLCSRPLQVGGHRNVFGIAGGAAGLGEHDGVFGREYTVITGNQPVHVAFDIVIGDDGHLGLVFFDRGDPIEAVAPAIVGSRILAHHVQQFLFLHLLGILGGRLETGR